MAGEKQLRRLLIADSSEEFCTRLTDILQDRYEINVCPSGELVVDYMRLFQPDVVVLDLMMPGMDGISILEKAAAAGLKPNVLATTRLISDYITTSAERLHIGYIMIKPCNMRSLAARLTDMDLMTMQTDNPIRDPSISIDSVYLNLGLRPNLCGYRSAVEALLLLKGDPSLQLTKEIYPRVAEICGTTQEQVEHAIRSVITDAWKHRDEQVWATYFPVDRDGCVRRPTNSVFLARIAAYIRQREAEGGL